MKIAHVIDYFQPEMGYQETFLAKAQIESGHDVCVITSDRYAPGLFPGVKSILGNRIKGTGRFIEEGISVIRLPILFEVFGRVWIRKLRKTLLQIKPDIIFIHGILSTGTVVATSVKRDLEETKIIIDDHMLYIATRNWLKPIYFLFKKIYGKKICLTADSLAGVTREVRKFMVEYYGIPFEQIEVIPLGVDTRLFSQDLNAREEVRKQLHFSSDDVVFVYAGKLAAFKGPHLLIQAANNLLEKYPKIKILLIGNGPEKYETKIKRKAANSKFKNSFVFMDMVSNKELPRFYSASDVGVWPLGASMTMIEAMSCSLPVIIADNSGATERITTANSGLVYQNGEIKDLQQKMMMLLNETQRRIMSENARNFAETIDWQRISRRFIDSVS